MAAQGLGETQPTDWASIEDVAGLGTRPVITEESKPFWDAAAEGILLLERCDNCGLHLFPPRGVCRRCLGRSTSWVEVEPPAILHAFTVNHQPWMPGIKPYIIGLAELPEHDNVRLVGVMQGIEEEPSIGDQLSFGFVRSHVGLHRLYFSVWSAK